MPATPDEIARRLLGGGRYTIRFANEMVLRVTLGAVLLEFPGTEPSRELDERQVNELLLMFRYPAWEELPESLGPRAGVDALENYAFLQHCADILAARSRLRERASAAG
ncbi:MAG: hypothetical protein GEU94_02170 [Micromonosporaceae bacterium]|nr:hypothetical protein [Micromonosporaceae bacterium]